MVRRIDRLGLKVFILIIACIAGPSAGCNRARQNSGARSKKVATVSVAAAADLKFALDDIVTAFTKTSPNTSVKVTYGSSGNFFSQLSNRAPFDAFFSADIEYPHKLIERGLASKGSEFHYATGRIVVWVPNQSQLDLEKLGIQALIAPSVKKIAIANPAHAPYGRAAEAAMKEMGVYERAKDRLVLGENIAQTAQFVQTGAADIGIVALSLAMGPNMKGKGRYWEVPLDSYPRMDQGGVVLNWAQDPKAARQFVDFIIGPEGKTILRSYGFSTAGE
ncbi:MAG TPA: molybdate ABC transporter substrate-binding protein [Blastocatellia bacterium]|nr:molybdate ABC transporter substrate-binding protein [Blastocatellia bacterium]